MIERPPSDAPRGLCPVRGGCSARGCAAMRAVAVLRTAMRSAALDRTVGRVRGGLSGVRWLQCARLGCGARGCSGLPCALRVTDPLDASARVVSGVRWLQCARLRCDARGLRWAALRAPRDRSAGRSRAGCVRCAVVAVRAVALRCARLRTAMRAVALRCARLRTAMRAGLRPAVLQLRWGQRNRPGSDATEHQGAFYFLDRLGDLDAAGAGVGAVEGGTTAPDPLRI